MAEYTTPAVPAARPLLPELFALLAAQRPAFTQDRPFHRAEALGRRLAVRRSAATPSPRPCSPSAKGAPTGAAGTASSAPRAWTTTG